MGYKSSSVVPVVSDNSSYISRVSFIIFGIVFTIISLINPSCFGISKSSSKFNGSYIFFWIFKHVVHIGYFKLNGKLQVYSDWTDYSATFHTLSRKTNPKKKLKAYFFLILAKCFKLTFLIIDVICVYIYI